MAFNFSKPFSHAAQLLRLSSGWRCSSISTVPYRSQHSPRLAEAHSRSNNPELCNFLAIRSLHNNGSAQDVQPKTEDNSRKRKRKGKNSLRRVAVEAQRSKEINLFEKSVTAVNTPTMKMVIAFSAAEQYDMAHVTRILSSLGYQQDPSGTDMYPQVAHFEIDIKGPLAFQGEGPGAKGDIFVFPSGAVVGWGIPHSMLSKLVAGSLLPAAQRPHMSKLEEEDLQFLEDPGKENSYIRGETIILGSKSRTLQIDSDPSELSHDGRNAQREPEAGAEGKQTCQRETVLAKIAFSSGLARSTKLAVLESQLSDYFDTTRTMVDQLTRQGRLRMRRRAILSKTGELLGIRAQLNLYSELTDSLPDLFWDSRSDLGLEGYYDQVGRALDINIRVKELNEKMNYAQEIADTLREATSERNSLRGENTIIVMIGVEIMFSLLHEFDLRLVEVMEMVWRWFF